METLAQWINRRGPLAPKDAVGWAIRLAKHLEALHLHGVAHGNVSPACVVIESNDPRSRGLVADVRRTAEMVQYHSPERFRNGQLSPSDDAWGLAGTLFSALTASRPFGELRPEIEARVYQGPPHLGQYRVNDEGLTHIVGRALSADPAQRTTSVAAFRSQLEQWYADPSVRELVALEDEEGSEEDQAATAMLPMNQMVFEESTGSKNPESLANLFAPPSFEPASSMSSEPVPSPRGGPPRPPGGPLGRPGGPPPPSPSQPGAGGAPRPSAQQPAPMSASPMGEQDATVMRELPAHIMAMAARAASGSNPPPAPVQDEESDADFGASTKIAPAPDLAAIMGAMQPQPQPAGPRPGAPPAAPQMPPARLAPPPPNAGPMPGQSALQPPPNAGGPPPGPGGRPPIPRAFKSTQLGMGSPAAPAPQMPPQMPMPPMAPPVAPTPPGPPAPRPGFAPPPASISSAPPAGFPAPGPAAPGPFSPQAAPPAFAPQPGRGAAAPPGIPLAEVDIPSATDDEDDEDGGRTVMRESPNVSEIFRSPAPAPAAAAAQAWKPAMPPAQGSSQMGSSPSHPAVQQPGPRPFPERSPSGPMAPGPPAAPAGPSPLGGLIQETIENMGAGPAPVPGAFPSETPSLGGGIPAASPSNAGGPFAPIGGSGFTPAPWAQQGNEVSGSFALGQGPSAPQGAQPFPSPAFGPPGGLPGLAPPAAAPGFGQAPAFGPPAAVAAPAYPVGGAAAAVEPAAAPAKRSKGGLFVVCFLVLILAAAVTFSVLRFRPQLGF